MKHLLFDINLHSKEGTIYNIEVTEDYEGDKFHVKIFEKDENSYDHYQTLGFDSEKGLFKYLRILQND